MEAPRSPWYRPQVEDETNTRVEMGMQTMESCTFVAREMVKSVLTDAHGFFNVRLVERSSRVIFVSEGNKEQVESVVGQGFAQIQKEIDVEPGMFEVNLSFSHANTEPGSIGSIEVTSTVDFDELSHVRDVSNAYLKERVSTRESSDIYEDTETTQELQEQVVDMFHELVHPYLIVNPYKAEPVNLVAQERIMGLCVSIDEAQEVVDMLHTQLGEVLSGSDALNESVQTNKRCVVTSAKVPGHPSYACIWVELG